MSYLISWRNQFRFFGKNEPRAMAHIMRWEDMQKWAADLQYEVTSVCGRVTFRPDWASTMSHPSLNTTCQECLNLTTGEWAFVGRLSFRESNLKEE